MRLIVLLAAAALSLAAPAVAEPPVAQPTVAEPPLAELPPLRSEPVTDRTRDLARRVIEAERGGHDTLAMAEIGADAAASLLGPIPPELKMAVAAAIRDGTPELDAVRASGVEVYARNYTDAELTALIEYFAHPLTGSLHRKRLDARLGRPAEITPDETAAERRFLTSEMGRSLAAKKMQVTVGLVVSQQAEMQRFAERVLAIYCQSDPCVDGRPVRPAAPE